MSAPMLLLRVVPPILRQSDRAHRMIERSLYVNKMSWMIIVSGFFEPLFYLFSIRIGFGSLVGDITFAGRSIEYAEFVAPALMASSAMNGAVYDSTMNVYFKLRHARLYDGILATPMGSRDVAVGEIRPLTDVRGSSDYRFQLARNVLLKFFHEQQVAVG